MLFESYRRQSVRSPLVSRQKYAWSPIARAGRARRPSKRNESLHFGVAYYAASTRARTTVIGGVNKNYAVLTDPDDADNRELHWGDMWHYPISRMVVAARANGLRPVDGPFGDFSNDEGYRAQARRSATLGMVGKWAIHPKQIALANEVFTPSEEAVAEARVLLDAAEQAVEQARLAKRIDELAKRDLQLTEECARQQTRIEQARTCSERVLAIRKSLALYQVAETDLEQLRHWDQEIARLAGRASGHQLA